MKKCRECLKQTNRYGQGHSKTCSSSGKEQDPLIRRTRGQALTVKRLTKEWNKKEKTYWNGEPATCTRVRVVMGPAPKGWWCHGFDGDVREAVRVEYYDQVFYLDDAGGIGWHKVTVGRGSPNLRHHTPTVLTEVGEHNVFGWYEGEVYTSIKEAALAAGNVSGVVECYSWFEYEGKLYDKKLAFTSIDGCMEKAEDAS